MKKKTRSSMVTILFSFIVKLSKNLEIQNKRANSKKKFIICKVHVRGVKIVCLIGFVIVDICRNQPKHLEIKTKTNKNKM